MQKGFRTDGHVSTVRSAWTKIEILSGTPNERTHWLRDLSAHAPRDEVALLTDFLPAILGIPDHQSLEVLCPYLYHPDSLVRQYAMYGLTYWPNGEAESRVLETLRTKGPSDVSVQFLVRRPELLAADGESIVENALPYLQSNSPVLLRGAVTALSALSAEAHLPQSLRARAETALLDAEDHIAAVADTQTATDYACALGLTQDNRGSTVLWDLVRRNVAREQATIALTWRHAAQDLAKLTQLALAPANGNPLARELASLPYALRRGYGEAADPYLEKLLEHSEIHLGSHQQRARARPGGKTRGLCVYDRRDRNCETVSVGAD